MPKKHYFREILSGVGDSNNDVELTWKPPWDQAITHITQYQLAEHGGDGEFRVGVRSGAYDDWNGPAPGDGNNAGSTTIFDKTFVRDGEVLVVLFTNSDDDELLTARFQGYWVSTDDDDE